MGQTFLRRSVFWTHLVLGLTAGLVILSAAVTGSIIAFEPQIVTFAERHQRNVSVPTDAPALPLAELVLQANKAKPRIDVSGVTVFNKPGASVIVSFGRAGSVFVNPYSGVVLGGESKIYEVLHGVEEWHRWLFSKEKARWVTGAANVGFFFLVLTGLYIWFPRTLARAAWRSVTRFNGRLTGHARNWNWHNVIGFWTSAVLIVVTLTGMVMSYRWATALLYRVTGNEPPPVEIQRRGAAAPVRSGAEGKVDDAARRRLPMVEDPVWSPASLDIMLAAAVAKAAPTGWKSIFLRYPQKRGDPFTAMILEPSLWHPAARSTLTLTPKGEEKKWEPFAAVNWGQKLRLYTRGLHTGQAFGWIGQAVALLAAVGTIFLVGTGFAMTWRRYKNWRALR